MRILRCIYVKLTQFLVGVRLQENHFGLTTRFWLTTAVRFVMVAAAFSVMCSVLQFWVAQQVLVTFYCALWSLHSDDVGVWVGLRWHDYSALVELMKICFVEQRRYAMLTSRAGLKGRGARGNFQWEAPMTYFMTSSFVKFTFSLIRKVPVCFFR